MCRDNLCGCDGIFRAEIFRSCRVKREQGRFRHALERPGPFSSPSNESVQCAASTAALGRSGAGAVRQIDKLKDRFPTHLRVDLGMTNIRDVVHKRLLRRQTAR